MTREHPCIKCGEPCDCADDLTENELGMKRCIGCSDCQEAEDDDE